MSFRKKTVTTAYINAAVRSTLVIQCSGGTSVQDHMTGRGWRRRGGECVEDHMTGRRRWRRGGTGVQDHMTGRRRWRRGGECEVVPRPCVGRLRCGVHRRCIRQSHKCWTWCESIMNRKLWGGIIIIINNYRPMLVCVLPWISFSLFSLRTDWAY